jgi:hypothetical protein
MYEIMEPDHRPELKEPLRADEVCNCSCGCPCTAIDQAVQLPNNSPRNDPGNYPIVHGLGR